MFKYIDHKSGWKMCYDETTIRIFNEDYEIYIYSDGSVTMDMISRAVLRIDKEGKIKQVARI